MKTENFKFQIGGRASQIFNFQFSIFNFQSPAFSTFLLLFFLSSAAPAEDATISLPLQGHYRPGRYIAVRISAHAQNPNSILRLTAQGALATEIQPSANSIDAIIPWLSIRTIRDVHWSLGGADHPVDLPLHALGEDDRLIGYVGADPDALVPLFPGKTLIRIALDPADPLPGDITAWESLDGLVLDTAAALRMKEHTLLGLLAGGTAIAIRVKQKPDDNLPWLHQGAFWITRADIAGPTSAFVPDAYIPTQTWPHGWPFSVRKRVILASIIFVILATAVTLWRSRWTVLLFVATCATATSLGFIWRHRQPVIIETGAAIIVRTDTTTQRDEWTYRAVLRPSHDQFPWQPLTRPVFAFRRQADDFSARLRCASDGHPLAFHYELKPLQSLAFQTRTLIAERDPTAVKMPITSPLRPMADTIYAGAADRMIGQVREWNDGHWPDVVIERPRTQP